MSWQIVLVLVLAGLVLVGAVVFGVLLALARKRANEAEANAEQWRGRYQESADVVGRLTSVVEDKELSDAEAVAKLHAGLADWSPVDPTGSSGSE